ncbi:MAG: glycosyltransferase [Desulfobacterales bacterium]|nr:glycosyltransferase [Desulfobacterales bacterium]
MTTAAATPPGRSIGQLAAETPNVRGVRLSRNFGHQYALLAGLEMADGQAVVMMDCDLQHPVENAARAPASKVAGRVHGGEDPATGRSTTLGWFKRWTSRTFYRLFSLSQRRGSAARPGGFPPAGPPGAARDAALQGGGAVPARPDRMDRVPVLRHPLPVRAARLHGQSRYSLKKMVKLGWSGVSSFSITPLAHRHPHRPDRQPGLGHSSVLYAFFGHFFGRRAGSRLGLDPDGDLAALLPAVRLSRGSRRIHRPHGHRGAAPPALHRQRDRRFPASRPLPHD